MRNPNLPLIPVLLLLGAALPAVAAPPLSAPLTVTKANVPTNPPQTVNGWLVHWPDPAYLDRVLDAAPRYGVNHLELSHDIIMQVDDATENPARGQLIESVARRAKAKGIQPFIWAHEINTRDKAAAPLDPDSPDGKAFWDARREAYRKTLRACPSVEGVVLMFGSAPYSVWSRPYTPNAGDGWQRKSPAQRVRFVTDLVCDVVVGEFHKAVFVRDFNHGPAELASIQQGLKDDGRITLISKAEPQDFQPFYPHSFTLGGYGTTPQIVELDLCGEYWGQSLLLASQAEYLPYRLKHDEARGTVGAVGRVDCFANSALGTPSEFNLFVYRRALADPAITADTLYADWMQTRYHLKPGSPPARALTAIFMRTWPMAKQMYYTLGFWTWKNQTSLPDKSASIDGGIVGKSSAQWDATQKPIEQKLLHPDTATFRAIVAEKAAAVALADENVRAIGALRGDLAPADYSDLETRLRLAADMARVFEALNRAYWRVKLAENEPQSPEASPEKINADLAALGPLADGLASRWADWPFVAGQAPRLRALQADLAARHRQHSASVAVSSGSGTRSEGYPLVTAPPQ